MVQEPDKIYYGIHIPEKLTHGHWSKKFINWIEQISMEKASGNLSLKAHLDELKHIRQIIADLPVLRQTGLNRGIRALAQSEEYRTNVRLLKTVTGISTLSAMTLLTELYNINRFKSLDKLSSFVGLIPNTNSSGEKDHKTSMTGRHNSILRALLIESSPVCRSTGRWVAVRKDPALIMAFDRLCQKTIKTKAIVSIARKLLNRIRYVLKNQKEYVPAVIE